MRTTINRRRIAITFSLVAVVLGTGTGTFAAAAGEAISAHVTTQHPVVGQPLQIAGQVTGASMAMSTVTVTRDDSTGSGTPVGSPVTTDNQGNFTVQDTPPARGAVTYHLSADSGAATTDVQTQVAGKPTDISVAVTPTPADADSTVHVTAHLGSPTTDRTVTLYARPYRQGRQQFDSGDVDANGNREADHAVERRTTFIAAFAGDTQYAPATATVTVRVRAVIDEQLRGGYGSSGGYRLYHANSNVDIYLHLHPGQKGACIVMRSQRKSHGSWHDASASNCSNEAIRTNANGEVIAEMQKPHIIGVPYRVRGEYRGGDGVLAQRGPWLLLRFHR